MSEPGVLAANPPRSSLRWRLWEERDLDQIMELEPILFGEDAWPREGFEAEMFHSETREYWVAESAVDGQLGELLAYGGVMVIAPTADIQTVGVAPAAQGNGLGRALMERLLAACARRGAESVLLEVRQGNEAALSLYRSLGFEQIHVRPNYYRGGESALIMQLALPRPNEMKKSEERA